MFSQPPNPKPGNPGPGNPQDVIEDRVYRPKNRPDRGPGSLAARSILLTRSGGLFEWTGTGQPTPFNPADPKNPYELVDRYPRSPGDHGLISQQQPGTTNPK
jgi:hypothetical protein